MQEAKVTDNRGVDKTKLIARLVLRRKGKIYWPINFALAINLVLSTLNVTSGTSISFTRDPATDKSSSFILRCVVLCIQTFFNRGLGSFLTR